MSTQLTAWFSRCSIAGRSSTALHRGILGPSDVLHAAAFFFSGEFVGRKTEAHPHGTYEQYTALHQELFIEYLVSWLELK